MKHDINSISDIQLLVNTFYGKVKEDSLIGDIFNNRIQDWDTHLEKMYRFWQTILLVEHTYHGSPFPIHATMSIDKEHFERWVFLWKKVIDDNFSGKVADEAKNRGNTMATIFHSKIEYFKNSNSTPLV